MGYLYQHLVPIRIHSYLHGVNPGFDASYTFYRGDSSPIQRTDGHQACGDWIMTVIELCKENTWESQGAGNIIQGVMSVRENHETVYP